MRSPAPRAALKLEDRYVDLGGRSTSRARPARRCSSRMRRGRMIDLNRAIEDMDWDMVSQGRSGRPPRLQGRPPARAAGSAWCRAALPGHRRTVERAARAQRSSTRGSSGIHRPYHAGARRRALRGTARPVGRGAADRPALDAAARPARRRRAGAGFRGGRPLRGLVRRGAVRSGVRPSRRHRAPRGAQPALRRGATCSTAMRRRWNGAARDAARSAAATYLDARCRSRGRASRAWSR